MSEHLLGARCSVENTPHPQTLPRTCPLLFLQVQDLVKSLGSVLHGDPSVLLLPLLLLFGKFTRFFTSQFLSFPRAQHKGEAPTARGLHYVVFPQPPFLSCTACLGQQWLHTVLSCFVSLLGIAHILILSSRHFSLTRNQAWARALCMCRAQCLLAANRLSLRVLGEIQTDRSSQPSLIADSESTYL